MNGAAARTAPRPDARRDSRRGGAVRDAPPRHAVQPHGVAGRPWVAADIFFILSGFVLMHSCGQRIPSDPGRVHAPACRRQTERASTQDLPRARRDGAALLRRPARRQAGHAQLDRPRALAGPFRVGPGAVVGASAQPPLMRMARPHLLPALCDPLPDPHAADRGGPFQPVRSGGITDGHLGDHDPGVGAVGAPGPPRKGPASHANKRLAIGIGVPGRVASALRPRQRRTRDHRRQSRSQLGEDDIVRFEDVYGSGAIRIRGTIQTSRGLDAQQLRGDERVDLRLE